MTPSPKGAARWYFTVMGGIGALFIFVGFWPTYYGPLLTGDVTVHSPFYHVHGLVSIGWMGLFVVQAVLAATKRTRTHIAVGKRGFVLGVLMAAFGVAMIVYFLLRIQAQDGIPSFANGLYRSSSPVADIIQFSILIALGWRNRKRHAFHKRYMLFATIAVLPPGVGRMGWLLGPWSLEMLYSPMLLAVAAYDLWTERKVHPATWVGLALLIPRVALEASYKIF